MNRDQILTRLKQLEPAQFAEVLFQYQAPESDLPNATQTECAIALIKWAEQRNDLTGLDAVIERILPVAKNRIPPLEKGVTGGICKESQSSPAFNHTAPAVPPY